MAISYGFRPRSPAERLRMGMLLTRAPARVELLGDDGWLAACLMMGGRQVVLGERCDVARARRVLHRLGLPRPATGPVDGRVDPFLELSGARQPGRVEPVPVLGPSVAVVIRPSRGAAGLPHALASIESQTLSPEVVLACAGDPPGFAKWRARHADVRVVSGSDPLAALWLAVERTPTEHVLVMDDDDLLLPGSLQVLAHALEVHSDVAAVRGDVVRFDAAAGRVTGYVPAPPVPAEQSLRALLHGWTGPLGAVLVRREVLRRALEQAGLRPSDADLQVPLARMGGIHTVPLPTLLWRERARAPGDELTAEALAILERPTRDRAEAHGWADAWNRVDRPAEARRVLAGWPGPGAAAEARVRTAAGIAPAPRGRTETVIVLDDGDVGALEATLARLRPGYDLWVDLDVPRDPLPMVRRLWDGQFGIQERLRGWVTAPGPWHFRLTSDPDWCPPPLIDPSMVPDLPPVDAVLALAAALGWELPNSPRAWRFRPMHPATRAAIIARRSIDRARFAQARQALEAVRLLLPDWRVADAFQVALANRVDALRHPRIERAGAA